VVSTETHRIKLLHDLHGLPQSSKGHKETPDNPADSSSKATTILVTEFISARLNYCVHFFVGHHGRSAFLGVTEQSVDRNGIWRGSIDFKKQPALKSKFDHATIEDFGRYPDVPKPVTSGGSLDRLMEKYPNLYCDLSGPGGEKALARDQLQLILNQFPDTPSAREARKLLRQMKSATELEDGTEKSAVTPGPLAPARELLGEMLLELNQPMQALEQFEATLKKEPRRFRSLYGAAHAGQLSGNRDTSEKYFRELLIVCARSDMPARSQLQEAGRSILQK
jgi:hypothetical protein